LVHRIGPHVIVPNYLAIAPGVGVNGVWVGAANDLVTGNLKLWTNIANVESIPVPGYWTHKEGSSIDIASAYQPGEKVVYHLHGGSYIFCSAHPKDLTAMIAKGFLQFVEPVTRVFAVEYRLASGKPLKEEHPFPTQLLDALAGYNYLVSVVGIAPKDIIIVGDSASGNLAQALTRYLTEYQGITEVPLPAPPGALVLVCPSTDMSLTHESLPNGSARKFVKSDHLIPGNPATRYARKAFTGPHGLGIAETNPYISPSSLHPDLVVDFKKFPRTLIVSGGAEVYYDSIKILKDRMVADLGEGNGVKTGEGKVHYIEAPDGVHDYLILAWHEPERTDTFNEINEWVRTGLFL
jgi:acetyl esterase/lipase